MKTLLPSTAFLAVAGFMMATPALADDPAPSSSAGTPCPFTNQLRHWKDVDNHTAIIEMGVNQNYKVTFFDDCREMRDAIFAKVESRPGLCLSSGDRITFGPRHGTPSTCVVQSVEKMQSGTTPASAEAPAH